jgi:DNA repair exonuclease SbcCD nuclease subunit
MERLHSADIPVYAVRGNHDSAEGYNAGLSMPANVHYFGDDRVERIVYERDGAPVCSLYGRGYPVRQVTENYAADYARDPADTFAIGVLHTNVGGREGWEPYAPASLDDLRRSGMDYWALGHIHGFEVVDDEPLAIYAGSPQGVDPTETGAHGCVLVTVEDGAPRVDFIETAAVRWERVEIDLSSAEGIDDVQAAITSALTDLSSAAGQAGVIARIRLAGRSVVHRALSSEGTREDLLAHVREIGSELSPWVWVDRLVDGTGSAIDAEALAESEGFLGDIVRKADALDPDGAVAEILEELRSRLSVCPNLELDSHDIVAQARDACLDLLMDEEGSA